MDVMEHGETEISEIPEVTKVQRSESQRTDSQRTKTKCRFGSSNLGH